MSAIAHAAAPATLSAQPPVVPAANDRLVEIMELLSPSLGRRLGYFGSADWVLFCYDPRAHDVVWDDGHTYGIGTGGWQTFLDVIAPLAKRYGVNVGSATAKPTDALLLNRSDYSAYFAPRLDAEQWVRRQHRSRHSQRSGRTTHGR